MPASPNENFGVQVKLVIKSNGATIDDALEVLSVSIFKGVNQIPKADIVLRDGNMPANTFPASDSDHFIPGSTIEIEAGYGDEAENIFTGVVIGQRLSINDDTLGTLYVECRDQAVAMTVGRKSENFVNSKDSDIATKLIGNTSGLSADVQTTDIEWKELVQYYCTDWDFLLTRAEASGFVVIVENAKVSVKAPDTSSEPDLKVTYGVDLIEISSRLESRDQFSSVQATAWDIKNQQVVQAKASPASLNKQGNIDSAHLAKTLDIGTYTLQTPLFLDSDGLQAWAKAQQIKSGLSRLRGNMKFQGSAKAKVGAPLEVDGVGTRFSGNVYVSAITHEIRDGNWISNVEFGLSPSWYPESGDLEAPVASGFLPGIQGLHLGVVKKLEEDPEGQYRVQVTNPVMQAKTEGVWARLMQPHATQDHGAFFFPEIGDEVVLGYFNNNPSAPVILGSLYSSKRKPAYTPADDNNKKAISTRSGLTLEYDDEKKVITLLTPGNNTIVISDEDKSILLQDQNDNKVELASGGISLDSPKDIKLTAQGSISLTATSAVQIKATQDATMQGLNVSHTADASFTAKGNASAELSASGSTTVKGAMVMIN